MATDLQSLHAIVPTLAAYALSFVFVGIYWNNHHHMLRASNGIDGRVMWANLHLLFWLSLAPFTTSWLGENPSASVPTALYGARIAAGCHCVHDLANALVAVNGPDTPFAKAVKSDFKGIISPVLYVCAIGFAFVAPIVSDLMYVAVAIIWFVPDRRFEPVIADRR